MAEEGASPPDPLALMRSRQFLGFLAVASVIGLIGSFAAWCFLEGVHLIGDGVYNDLPDDLGFSHTPLWWPVPILAIAGVIVAFAIARLPGAGGHIPADGLNASPTQPIDLPGVMLAALAGIGLGVALGPEAPLIALGGGIGVFCIRRVRSDAPPELAELAGACGTFAAVSFLFGSPIIAAVLLIEAAAIGGARQQLLLIPGLLAAGIGTLVSNGMGSWTGVDQSDISLTLLHLPAYARPDVTDFLWTIPLAAAIALLVTVVLRIARIVVGLAAPRPFVVVPVVGVLVAGLAMLFAEFTDHGTSFVLFSGQEQLSPLVDGAGEWSAGALIALVALKGAAYAISLGSFRGGPAFPGILVGAAAGLFVANLTGLALTAGVAVGIGAATVAVLRLPLSAVVLATLLVSQSGVGVAPLIIVGVVVAYLVVNVIEPPETAPGPEVSAQGSA